MTSSPKANCAFGKGDRVCKRHEFVRIQRRGAKHQGLFLTLIGVKNFRNVSGRLGLTTGKKVGDAPTRNLIKRRLRQVFRENRAAFEGLDVVVIASPRTHTASFSALKDDLLSSVSALRSKLSNRMRARNDVVV